MNVQEFAMILSGIRVRAFVLALIVVLSGYGSCHAQTDDATGSGDASSATASASAWQMFRSAHPFHTQVVALSKAQSDGHRTLIISEPPPTVQLADVVKLSPRLASAKVKQMRIGVDGWVRDIVID
jgi:hypothetical protein